MLKMPSINSMARNYVMLQLLYHLIAPTADALLVHEDEDLQVQEGEEAQVREDVVQAPADVEAREEEATIVQGRPQERKDKELDLLNELGEILHQETNDHELEAPNGVQSDQNEA